VNLRHIDSGLRILTLGGMLLLQAATAQAAMSAHEIVATTDRVRNPDRPFSMQITLTEYISAKPRDSLIVTVYSKQETDSGQFRSLIHFLKPERDVDKLMLRRGSEIWFYDPNQKASVRVSPQQRLLGQASNGDVMTSNFALDYDSQLVGEETVQDADRKDRLCYRLKMKATNPAVPYDSVELWVDKANFHPVKGKFYAESGRLLKIAFYRRYAPQLGAERPTEVVIIDGVDQTKVTKMSFADYHYRDIPEYWYQRTFLPRFKAE
jgi:Outer membrane lipoprotein-sorting protein